MGENHKKCQDCGWRETAAEQDQTADDSGGQTHIFCLDCGGMDIIDLNPDDK
jgi:hypothetical protein